MSTRKSALVVLSARIRAFPLFVAFPLRCLDEVTEGLTDLLCPFRRANKKFWTGLCAVDDTLAMLRSSGPMDIMDVDVQSKDERVQFRLLMR